MYSPYKSGSTVYEYATATCTSDVYYLAGTDYLYRGLSTIYLIGSQNEKANTNYIYWEPHGSCASSTWAYWADIPQLTSCSSINGCVYTGGYQSPAQYISC
jgi:hypothetical protein